MDVYHKILIKLYDATDGKDSKKIDFKDLVKKEGFSPSYLDIYKQMSQSGWIAEAGRADAVNITHWGAMEAKKVLAGGGGDSKKELEKSTTLLRANVKEFLVMTDQFASDMSRENFELIENKFGEIKSSIDKVKKSL